MGDRYGDGGLGCWWNIRGPYQPSCESLLFNYLLPAKLKGMTGHDSDGGI
jgi:hypothetical protein